MKQKNSFNAVLEEEHCADRYGVKNTNGKKWTQTVIGESYFKTLFLGVSKLTMKSLCGALTRIEILSEMLCNLYHALKPSLHCLDI